LLKIQQLENQPAKIVEIIKEIPVEKVVVQEKIVEIEKPIEVIKEIVIERGDDLKPKLEALQQTVQKLKLDNIEKDKKIKEYEKTIQDIQKFQEDKKAMFLRGSNLDDNLYK
jgi:heterodisulfide reductase subunit C